MSNTDKKQYKCVLPTNGYAEGEIVWLADAEVANFNGGEKLPRFVPVEEASESTTMSEENKDTETTPPANEGGEGEAGKEGEGQEGGEAGAGEEGQGEAGKEGEAGQQ